MSGRDFKQLSSRDFEEVTRDLLQAEWSVALEAFKTGRDQGIDLRHIAVDKTATIIQCKHYAGSGYAKLVTHLRSNELEKVKKLNPKRYVLVTSVELSPKNKEVIAELFAPYILAPSDVLGADDLDGLLQRHPEVARANLKLWLTSTEVLERVLHNAEACQTEFAVERAIRKLPIFVQNAALPRAQDILDKTNVLVISGVPGIGKTTLAEMLLYTHLEQGYEPVVIQTDVREGKNLFSSKRPQVFYFDDFLGQTFLGENRFPGGVNNDMSLVDFVEMIKATGKSRFILTAREHLLQSARAVSERLHHSSLLDHRCLIELADYTKGQRARILYNHLYFSDLPREYKEHMLRDDFFLEVVGHKHFNPRLIEWLSSTARLRNVTSAQYQDHVRSILANPQTIWSHAFNQQISASARNVILALYSLGGSSELSEFADIWTSLNAHTASKYQRPVTSRDYQNALKELDNAFVSYRSGRIEFLNPSVGEMVAGEIADCPEQAIELVAAARRFRQIITIFELSQQSGRTAIKDAISKNANTLMKSITSLLHTPHLRWDTNTKSQRIGTYIDLPLEQRITHIGEIAHVFQLAPLRALFESEIHALSARYQKAGFDMSYATSLVEAFDELPQLKAGRGATLQRELLDGILANEDSLWADQLNTLIQFSKEVSIWSHTDDARLDEAIAQYKKSGLDDEYDSCNGADDYERLRDDLVTLGEHLGISFARYIERIEERLAELLPPDDEGYSGGSWRSAGSSTSDGEANTDDAIRDVFGTLLD